MPRLARTLAAAGLLTALVAPALAATAAQADGIVVKIVNSPLNAAGLVRDGYTALNIYLQKPGAEGIEFYNPEVPGFGIPAGGHIEVELGGGFTRDRAVAMDTAAVHMVSGTPQQGLSSTGLGYQSVVGANENTFVVSAVSPDGLAPQMLLPRATVEKLDPIPNIGLKTFYIGLGVIAFTNRGSGGWVEVRVVDGDGKVTDRGRAEVSFRDAPRAQIHPNNMLHQDRNHNWQRVAPGTNVGQADGTIPLTFMLFDKPTGTAAEIREFRDGIAGAGVVSRAQLAALEFAVPETLQRYDSALIVHDTNADGTLDPRTDRIIGGVSTEAPAGASELDVRSLVEDGKPLLSQPTGVYSERAGARFGGAIMQVQFTAGAAKGKYRPTFALLADPARPERGDGSSYTYTIVVR
jgi:hypothetical protein